MNSSKGRLHSQNLKSRNFCQWYSFFVALSSFVWFWRKTPLYIWGRGHHSCRLKEWRWLTKACWRSKVTSRHCTKPLSNTGYLSMCIFWGLSLLSFVERKNKFMHHMHRLLIMHALDSTADSCGSCSVIVATLLQDVPAKEGESGGLCLDFTVIDNTSRSAAADSFFFFFFKYWNLLCVCVFSRQSSAQKTIISKSASHWIWRPCVGRWNFRWCCLTRFTVVVLFRCALWPLARVTRKAREHDADEEYKTWMVL